MNVFVKFYDEFFCFCFSKKYENKTCSLANYNGLLREKCFFVEQDGSARDAGRLNEASHFSKKNKIKLVES